MAAASIKEWEQSFSAFSGADIVAFLGHKRITNFQGITVQITREILPRYVAGDPNYKTVVKGKRAIAGNLSMTQFDKHALLRMARMFNNTPKTLGDLQTQSLQIESNGTSRLNTLRGAGGIVGAPGGFASGVTSSSVADAAFINALNAERAEALALISRRVFKYADQIPPFDITIAFSNELGQSAHFALHEVQIVNETFGWDIDQMNPEAMFTFIARSITPLDNSSTPESMSSTTGNFDFSGLDVSSKLG